MNEATHAVAAIFSAVIGVAVVAVLVSRNSATASVLQAGGQAFSSILGVAVSPVAAGRVAVQPAAGGGGAGGSGVGGGGGSPLAMLGLGGGSGTGGGGGSSINVAQVASIAAMFV